MYTSLGKQTAVLEGVFAGLSQLVGDVVQLGVLVLGGRLVLRGKLTIGNLKKKFKKKN